MPKEDRKMKRSNSGTFIHEDKTGKRYGKLTVIDYLGNGEWFCLCDCGKSKIARSGHLNAGHYVKIKGTQASSRKKMWDAYGAKWAFQYSEEEWERLKNDPNRRWPMETELKTIE